MDLLISHASVKPTNQPTHKPTSKSPVPFTVFLIKADGNFILLVAQAPKCGVIMDSFLFFFIFYI